jgi:nickel-dependent lactate racemase
MLCNLSYGKKGLDVTLPDDWDITVLRKTKMPVVPDPAAAVAAALDAPLGSGTIPAEAKGRSSACILVCDITRPVPNGLILRPVIERLRGAGVKSITVLVATGLHRPNEGLELQEVIGDPWVFDHASVVNHFARRAGDHAAVGTTRQGIPVALDRRFLEADIRIAVGLVEPHFMAGWSGGRKLALPGIASADTITAFHSARILGHPRADTAVLDGNPLHEAQNEVLGMIGPCLAMNLVIDESRALSFAGFGGIRESHAAAVRFAEPCFRVEAPREFPVVLCSAAGFPLDTTWYQAVKGVCCGASVLEKGGDLFVAAECAQGFGSAEFRESQRRLCTGGKGAFRAEAGARAHALIDEWETVMLLKALEAGNVHLYSGGLSDEDHGLTGVHRCDDLLAGMRNAVTRSGQRRVAVIPEGPYVAPFVRRQGKGGSE